MEINIYPFPKYNIKFKKYKEDYALRTAHIKTDNDIIIHEHDYEFEEWERESLEELNTLLQNEIKELNENKIFFYGCNLTNYKSNYQKRIDDFLEKTEDATELDFIQEEIEYFENSIYDIENAEASHDGYSLTGINNFLYLYKIIEAIGFRQFSISTNKIIEFLNDRKNELSKKQNNIIHNDANITEDKLKTLKTAVLTFDNLIAFGLDPNATNEEANIWERKNEDILIDFKNKIIYYNLIALKNEIGYLNEQLENEAKNINSEEDLQTFVNHVALEAKSDLKSLFNSMPKENIREFIIMFYKNVDEKVSSLKNVVFSSKISNFLNKEVTTSISKTEIINTPKTKKIPDKWYALLYLIEVEVYKKNIPINFDGAFIKSELEEIGKHRCNNSGQGFYRQIKELKGNISSNIEVKRFFNENWKNVIIELSKNDENIIKYLDTYYK